MAVVVKNLCKSFDGKPVLADFSCVFPDGKITCIVGPSGCGKTTLLNLMMNLFPADSGSIEGLAGHTIAAVFQEDRLLEHCSPAANLRAVLRSREAIAQIPDALRAVGLSDASDKSVRNLSGGMKRRVAILRALLTDADILLMDEPFRGLDTDTRAAVIHWMRPKIEGKTVILVTHDPAEAKLLGGTILELNPQKKTPD